MQPSILPLLNTGEGTSTLPGHSSAKTPVSVEEEEAGSKVTGSSAEASDNRLEVQQNTEFLGQLSQEPPLQRKVRFCALHALNDFVLCDVYI